MKQSRILKVISYLALTISITILILSIFTLSAKEDVYCNEEQYFNSEIFVGDYITYLENSIFELIHNNEYLYSIQDGEIEIHYPSGDEYYYADVKDRYYLIIYKNKALTNVELTNSTSSIKDIKEYIKNNENSKQVNIIKGDMQSESDIIERQGIKYLEHLERTYYTTIDNNITQYITAKAEDFEIYSSYVEEFKENTEIMVKNNLLKKLQPLEQYSYFIIPTSSVLIVLVSVYLIISIGYKKGVEGIALNDFDKIPLEPILIISIILGIIPVIILDGISNNYNTIASLIITAYFLIYILCSIVLNTIIKRVKSKTLLKTSIVGIVILCIANLLEKVLNKSKEAYYTVTYSTSITLKAFSYFVIVITVGIAILIAFRFSFITFILELTLALSVAYRIVKTIKGYAQIENKLKEMYEGNNKNPLNKQSFGKEFHNSVKYINDISNGFENAIQDRMKSERMKAELITNVSHDIKTPLTSIINYVDLLKKENIDNEKAKEYIGILDSKSQRLKKLTQDLVEASKVSTGNISLNLEKIDIIQLIKQALGEFEDKFKKRGLETIFDSEYNEIIIKADNRCMYRIIENLFNNIANYALENSRVYLDIRKTAKSVIIEMKNISKERLNISADELMQRFVRGDKSRTTEGSGLGISIAQNLTELQGGEFRLKLDGDLFKVELEWNLQ